jgi:hypothetical protein
MKLSWLRRNQRLALWKWEPDAGLSGPASKKSADHDLGKGIEPTPIDALAMYSFLGLLLFAPPKN